MKTQSYNDQVRHDKDGSLPSSSNYNISSISNKELNKMSSTKILNKKFTGKITARTSKGKDRSLTISAIFNKLDLMDLYLRAIGTNDQDRIKISLNLTADHKGRTLALKEGLYWITEQNVYSDGTKYTSSEALEKLQSLGILKKVSHSQYVKGVATEAVVNKVKKLAYIVSDSICFILDNSFFDIIELAESIYSISTDKVYWEDPTKQMIAKIAEKAYLTSLNRNNSEKFIRITFSLSRIKGIQSREGITSSLVLTLIDAFLPGYQPGRKQKIYEILQKKYSLEEKELEEIRKHQEYKEYQEQGVFEQTINKDKETETLLQKEQDKDMKVEGKGKKGKMRGELERLLQREIYRESHDLPCISPSFIHALETLPPAQLQPVRSTTPSALRAECSTYLSETISEYASVYNEAIGLNVLRYRCRDLQDVRQKEVLKREALPVEYLLLSDNSARMYSKRKDNLFYCRKDLRISALEGMGFKDVDMQSCHAQIAVSLWGEELKTLKEHLDKGTLWSYYKSHFESNGLKFYKGLIKGLHHASFLGGGKKAQEKILRGYNVKNKGKEIKEEEWKKIIKCFKDSEVYKELRKLFRKLSKEWHNKTITTITGESFDVRGYRKYKENGVTKSNPGNLLTAISAVLQSIEVTLISYMILRSKELFVPILWQHDGLTIKCLYSNTVELMQEALDEYSKKLLGRRIKLVATDLDQMK